MQIKLFEIYEMIKKLRYCCDFHFWNKVYISSSRPQEVSDWSVIYL